MKQKNSILGAIACIAAAGSSYGEYPGCAAPAQPCCECDYFLPDNNNYGVMFGVKGCETKKLIFSGLIQTDYQFIHVDDKTNQPNIDPADVNNFRVRRVRLGFEADLGEGWKGVIVTDFTGKENHVEYTGNGTAANFASAYSNSNTTTNWCNGALGIYNAYIEKYCSGNYFRAGYRKVNFGREELVDASELKTIERSIATNYFNGCQLANVASGSPLGIGKQHVGLFIDGSFEHFGYGAAITNGYKCAKNCSSSSVDSNGKPYSTDNELGYYGNLYYKNDFSCANIEIGVNLAYQPKGDNYRLQYNVFDANWSPKRGEAFGYNPYIMVKSACWSILAEYLGSHIENGSIAGLSDANPRGATILGTYMWNDQLEFVGRISYLDTDHRGTQISSVIPCAPNTAVNQTGTTYFVAGDLYDKASALYAGLNYYMMERAIKFSAGYEYAEFKDRHGGAQTTMKGTTVLDPNKFGSAPLNNFSVDKSKVHSVRARVQLVF